VPTPPPYFYLAAAAGYTVEADADYPCNDLGELKPSDVSSGPDCAAACARNPSCAGAVFNRASPTDARKGYCWLKSGSLGPDGCRPVNSPGLDAYKMLPTCKDGSFLFNNTCSAEPRIGRAMGRTARALMGEGAHRSEPHLSRDLFGPESTPGSTPARTCPGFRALACGFRFTLSPNSYRQR
jgi:hypothetical protein